MRHVGIICPEVLGHLNPVTTLGRELLRRGYEVTLIGRPSSRERARAAGLGFALYGEREFPVGSMERATAELGRLSGEEAVRYTVGLYCATGRALVQEAPAVVKDAGIDGLLVDQASHAGGTVADLSGVPFVTVCSALTFHAELCVPPFNTPWPYDPTPAGQARNARGYAALRALGRPILEVINARRDAAGLPAIEDARSAASKLAQVAQQPACFDFPRKELPACFHYTGPFHDGGGRAEVEFPFDRLDGRPLIYASMGTLQNQQQEIFRTIAAACADEDAQLVLTLGRADQEVPADLPGSPLVVPFAPQLELVRRASLVITHAGLNTVLETLSHGVPMVAIPIANDQPGVAARLSYLGAGEMVPIAELTAGRLSEAVRRVLSGPEYRARAEWVQSELRNVDGVRLAADIAIQALTTGQPVLRAQSGSNGFARSKGSLPRVRDRA